MLAAQQQPRPIDCQRDDAHCPGILIAQHSAAGRAMRVLALVALVAVATGRDAGDQYPAMCVTVQIVWRNPQIMFRWSPRGWA
jgi:hypothetical protein